MEYQNLSFSPTQKTNSFNVTGDGFWYVDATADDGVNTKISVTPDGGSALVVKPGQHFRLEAPCEKWTIASVDGTATFTGNIMIGSGDFGDSNINNTFKLDASFANNVTVMNDNAHAVPVSLIGGEVEVKNDIGNPLNTQDIMSYASAYQTSNDTTTAQAVVLPAANVNGVTVYLHTIIGNVPATGLISLLAKTSTPADHRDGDLLSVLNITATGSQFQKDKVSVKVPAGKGVYICSNGSTLNAIKSVLYTVH